MKMMSKMSSDDICSEYKNDNIKGSAWWCPSQGTKSLTQIDEKGILIPIKLWSWSKSRGTTKGNCDDRFSMGNTGWMTVGKHGGVGE
jgi:hypothetical protein